MTNGISAITVVLAEMPLRVRSALLTLSGSCPIGGREPSSVSSERSVTMIMGDR